MFSLGRLAIDLRLVNASADTWRECILHDQSNVFAENRACHQPRLQDDVLLLYLAGAV